MQHINRLRTPKLIQKAKVLKRTHQNIIKLAREIVMAERRIAKASEIKEEVLLIDEQLVGEDSAKFLRIVAGEIGKGMLKAGLGSQMASPVMTAMKLIGSKKKPKKQKPLRTIVPPQPKKQKQQPKSSIQILKPWERRTNAGHQLRQLPSHYHRLNELFGELMLEYLEQKLITKM